MDNALRFFLRLSVHDYHSMDNLSLAWELAWIYDWLYGRRLCWLSLPGSLHTRERPRILVLRCSRTQASASLENTRVAPHQLASDLVGSSKNRIFKAVLCLEGYLFCARAGQPAKTWGTLSGNLPHNLQRTSLSGVVRTFWLVYNLVGNVCSYNSNSTPWATIEKHPFMLRSSSSHLFVISFPSHFWSLITLKSCVSKHFFIFALTPPAGISSPLAS